MAKFYLFSFKKNHRIEDTFDSRALKVAPRIICDTETFESGPQLGQKKLYRERSCNNEKNSEGFMLSPPSTYHLLL